MAAAPSSPSSSCDIVDLAEAATLDDAISKLFFSKDGGGGGGDDDLSWPEAAAIESTLTDKASLLAGCDRYAVPRELEPVCAGARPACDAPTNALCIYADAFEFGLRFPMPAFYGNLLRHYGLAPSQLTPDSWAVMAAFLRICEISEVPEQQQVSTFAYFFTLCAHKRDNTPLGWHHFKTCAGHRQCVDDNLPPKHGWESRFLFLEPSEGMPWSCPVAWGKPRREAVGVVELRDAAVKKVDSSTRSFPCLHLRYFLRLPITGLKVKPGSAAPAGILDWTSLHGEADGMTWGTRPKRRCPCPRPTSVTVSPPVPQSFAISDVLLQGLKMIACQPQQAAHREQPANAKAAQETAHLQAQLQQAAHREQQANAAIAKFKDYWTAATAENAQLKEKIAKLNQEHASEVAKLQEKHDAEVATLNQAHHAAVIWLREEHEVEVARVKHAAEAAVDAKKDTALTLFPDLDASFL